MHAPLRVGFENDQFRPAHARGLLPGHQVGMVLQPAHDDAVAGAQPGLARPRCPQPLGHEVQRLGRAAGEDQFMLHARADEALERGARLFKGVGGALAQRVHAAVNVGAVMAFEALHGFLHRQRHLRGGGVVQIGQRLAVDALRQHRKLRAQCLHRQATGVQQRMWFTHGVPPRLWAAAGRSHRPASRSAATAPACRPPRPPGIDQATLGPCLR